jgi:hypothetical protein
MLKAMILIWLVLLVLVLNVVAFMTRFMEKHRPAITSSSLRKTN